jgi:hypothetical protein
MAETPATDELDDLRRPAANGLYVTVSEELRIAVLARLDAAEAALREREWQRITDEQRDGKRFMISDGEYVTFGDWWGGPECGHWEDDFAETIRPQPTHFQAVPLPSAPKEA